VEGQFKLSPLSRAYNTPRADPRQFSAHERADPRRVSLIRRKKLSESTRRMPRYTLDPGSETRSPEREFDLCARCVEQTEIVRVVAIKKSGLPLGSDANPPVARIRHTSYDFAPRPIPCISCGRVLSADDD
jgi:hypothetical protein